MMDESSSSVTSELQLPGFRFHPTEEELIGFYLKNMVLGRKLRYDIIGLLNIYRYDPWELPGLAKIGEREWYFYVERDRKHGSGGRPNRITEHGFWKATGTDRKIFSMSDQKRMIGLKKTLVFYKGRAPRGCKTDWVMNEYRLPDHSSFSSPKDIVLCKIYRKATSLKVLEQRAAMDEMMLKTRTPPPYEYVPPPPPSSMDTTTISFCCRHDNPTTVPTSGSSHVCFKKEHDEQEVRGAAILLEEKHEVHTEQQQQQQQLLISKPNSSTSSSLKLPGGNGFLAELQLPKLSMDWTQDPFWTQLRSPWLDNFLTTTPPYAMF